MEEYDREQHPTDVSWYSAPLMIILMIALPIFLLIILDFAYISNPTLSEIVKYRPMIRQWIRALHLFHFELVLAFLALNALLYKLLPFSKTQLIYYNHGEERKYRLNGFAALTIVLLAIVISRYYFKFSFEIMIIAHWRPLTISMIIICVGLTFISNITSYFCDVRKNEKGYTGNVVTDFWYGRALNPQIFGIDLKQVIWRCGLLAWFIYDTCLLLESIDRHRLSVYHQSGRNKFVESSGRHYYDNYALILIVALQIVYIVDALINERFYTTSFDANNTGFGFKFLLTKLSLPVIASLPATYTYNQGLNQKLPNYLSTGIIIVLYTLGLYLVGRANSQKHDIMTHCVSSARRRTIATCDQNRRILIDGAWAWCRHPNYLGECLVTLAFGLSCGTDHFIPYVYSVLIFVYFIMRINSTEQIYLHKYKTAYNDYQMSVPAMIIPKLVLFDYFFISLSKKFR